MSSFSSISTALTALQSHRKAMDVTGNNIANANTLGYTRQRADLQSLVAPGTQSLFSTSRLNGNGVEVAGVVRAGDPFLDARVRSQTSTSAYLTGKAQTVSSVERLMAEPGEQGLAAELQNMWKAWSELSDHPEPDSAARPLVIEATQAVVDRIASGYKSVETLWNQQRTQAGALVTEVNATASAVATFNEQIRAAVTNGGSPNELMDQRDQLVTRLVELTGASAQPGKDGMVDVYVGSNALVRGTGSEELALTGGPGALTVPVAPRFDLTWAGSTPVASATPSGGSLAASLEALNTDLPDAAKVYDEVAQALADRGNAVHRDGAGLPAGYPNGQALFSMDGAGAGAALQLRLVITDGKDLVAGDARRGANDNSVADVLSGLGSHPQGPDARWNDQVVATGVRVQAAERRADVAQQSLGAAVSDQMASAGVSLDEETANLLVIQRAYEGAARVLTAVDQALDTLINRTGLVGR